MSSLSPLLAIVGPTASGKTPLSLYLAERLNGEIVSADSRQIYKYLDIGTAKPSHAELRRVQHHFISLLDPKEEFNAGDYGRQARQTIKKLIERGKLPILVGGSGLYVKAVIDGLFEGPGKHPAIRAELEDRYQRVGGEPLLEELKKVDPTAARKMNPSKPRRIIRALEVFYATGQAISQFHSSQDRKPPFQAYQIALQWDRKELYGLINARVNTMLKSGLVEEVRSLHSRGYEPTLNSLNTVGYREMFQYLDGTLTLEEASDLIKRNTRRFAKRQLTWFRADERIRWIEMHTKRELEAVALHVEKEFEESLKR